MLFRETIDQDLEEKNKKKKKEIKFKAADEDPDEMDMELERKMFSNLNKQKSIFDSDSGNRTSGINTAPSVFEKSALFKPD